MKWTVNVVFFFCQQVIYCGQACQKMHWFTHKKVCKKLQEQRETQEAETAKLRLQQSKGTSNCSTQYEQISNRWADDFIILKHFRALLHISQ